jgi:hypothetical protein
MHDKGRSFVRVEACSPGALGPLIPLRGILHVDAQLLAFLIKMASLKPKCSGGLRGAPTVSLKLCQNHLPLEGKYALRQWSSLSLRAHAHGAAFASRRKCEAHILHIHLVAGQQK